ncbi:MAG: hypothetical protein N3A69_05235, partial [Leptospiraceae bacterium]|nr:hypothetical protein [Leptospiraceae bacterium]
MKVLITWREMPDPRHPSLARPFYFIKKFSKLLDISLIAPTFEGKDLSYEDTENIKLHTLKLYKSKKLISKALMSIQNRLNSQAIFDSRDFNFFRIYYPSIRKKIKEILFSEDFDLIYIDYMVQTYFNRLDFRNPILVEFFSPRLYSLQQLFKYSNLSKKFLFALEYVSFRFFEVGKYKKFEAGIFVSETHKRLQEPFVPNKCYVISPGVDLDYFKSKESSEESSIIFTGSMNYPINVFSILHFYNNICLLYT